MKYSISQEIRDAGIFTVKLDTTQYISVVDQCSIIIRYINGNSVHERLISVTKCISSKGMDFVELVLKMFNNLNINPKDRIRNVTDGAANMQGAYNGFFAKLSEVVVTNTCLMLCACIKFSEK